MCITLILSERTRHVIKSIQDDVNVTVHLG